VTGALSFRFNFAPRFVYFGHANNSETITVDPVQTLLRLLATIKEFDTEFEPFIFGLTIDLERQTCCHIELVSNLRRII
jgi:hypothetical protein